MSCTFDLFNAIVIITSLYAHVFVSTNICRPPSSTQFSGVEGIELRSDNEDITLTKPRQNNFNA